MRKQEFCNTWAKKRSLSSVGQLYGTHPVCLPVLRENIWRLITRSTVELTEPLHKSPKISMSLHLGPRSRTVQIECQDAPKAWADEFLVSMLKGQSQGGGQPRLEQEIAPLHLRAPGTFLLHPY